MTTLQKTVSYVLDLYSLKNVNELEKLVAEKKKLYLETDFKDRSKFDPTEIAFLECMIGMYWLN